MRAALLTLAVLLLAGCASTTPPPTVSQAALDLGVPGLDAQATLESTANTLVMKVRLTNGATHAYGYRDDCAASWVSYAILDGSGKEVYPVDRVACALYAEPRPLPPGQSVEKTLRWDGATGGDGAGHGGQAPAGDYVARVTVTLRDGTTNASPAVEGHRDFPFRFG